MEKVQHEKKRKVKDKAKNEKSGIRKKCNMGKIQHKKIVT